MPVLNMGLSQKHILKSIAFCLLVTLNVVIAYENTFAPEHFESDRKSPIFLVQELNIFEYTSAHISISAHQCEPRHVKPAMSDTNCAIQAQKMGRG